MIELKYTKNEKFEIEFENLDEIKDGDNVFLRIDQGDITPLASFASKNKKNVNLYIPLLTEQSNDCLDAAVCCFSFLENITHGDRVIKTYTFDSYDANEMSQENVIPNWSSYIDKDSAVLFLSEQDMLRYNDIGFYRVSYDRLIKDGGFPFKVEKPVYIITPELHSKNIQEINNIAKELKEKYGVERIEVFVSHCFEYLYDGKTSHLAIYGLNHMLRDKEGEPDVESCDLLDIDKITTTNSTGILDIQDSERLKVVDVKEFFE